MDQKTLSRIDYRQAVPPLQLLRTFRIALDVRKLALAGAGLLLIVLGNAGIDLFGLVEPAARRVGVLGTPWEAPGELLDRFLPAAGLPTTPAEFGTLFTNWWALLTPAFDGAFEPLRRLANAGGNTFAANVDALTRLLWFVLVWSVIGGAIARMAVHEFVRDERLSIQAGLGYSCRRILDYLTAPLIPLGGCLGLIVLMALGGLLGRIPGIGPALVGVLWIIPLILSVAVLIMLIGAVAGWPMMVPALSVEDSDGFDSFSRAHSFLFDSPWYYALLLATTAAYASAAVWFVDTATYGVFHLAQTGTGWGLGASALDSLNAEDSLGGIGLHVWLGVLVTLAIGFRISFLWTALTIVYLLMRKKVDNTGLKEVYFEGPEARPAGDIALSGMAAATTEVSERPVHNPDTENAVPDAPETANPGDSQVSAEDDGASPPPAASNS